MASMAIASIIVFLFETGSYLPMINCIKLITKAEMIKASHVFQLPRPPSREILSLFLTSFGSCFISSSLRSSITWFAITSSCSSVMPLSCSMVNKRNFSFVIMLFIYYLNLYPPHIFKWYYFFFFCRNNNTVYNIKSCIYCKSFFFYYTANTVITSTVIKDFEYSP